jgi:hypothetical protein
MKRRDIQFTLLRALAVCLLVTTVRLSAQPATKSQLDPAVSELGNGFVSSTAKVNDRFGRRRMFAYGIGLTQDLERHCYEPRVC